MSLLKQYFEGIRFKGRKIYVGTTGAVIDINSTFLKETKAVLKIYTYFKSLQFKHVFRKSDAIKTLAFYPQIPGPWFNIWQVSRLGGLKTVSDLEKADIIFAFEDSTETKFDPEFLAGHNKPVINHNIKNISKEHVADVFQETFGYSLRIDPTTHIGLAIRKSDANGTHDGVVIQCPIDKSELIEGQSYQHLVDSTFNGKTSEDLRVAYAMGELALIYHKHKPLDNRFGTHYLSVDVYEPEDVFSNEEINLIKSFCQTMHLDFGAIDVMRDKNNGRIYIVDVNKTCMPVLSLPLKTQIECQQKIADALMKGLENIQTFKT